LSLPSDDPDPASPVAAEPLASSVEVGAADEDVVRWTVATARPRQPLAKLGFWSFDNPMLYLIPRHPVELQ
ncbi:hypothetical protein KCU91_g109, partial [Aureobasidium melanogenum]